MRLLDSTFYHRHRLAGRCIYMCRVLTKAPPEDAAVPLSEPGLVGLDARKRPIAIKKSVSTAFDLALLPLPLLLLLLLHTADALAPACGRSLQTVGVTMSHFHKHENEMSENVLHFFVCL